jgi:UDP-4-amino-4,6-dideoxy-N-acetyl-beta-L-altrosamine transaminase
MQDAIPYARQSISSEDIEAVVQVLKSDFLTQGPAVEKFETAVASLCESAHAFAFSSATTGLHVAYLALGLGPGDILWTSPNTFVATANAALFCGASVDFVDIDPETQNMSAVALRAKLLEAEAQGRLPKILTVVHFAGQPCEMKEIAALCRPFGIRIVEDASHAVGARYAEKPVGSCEFSDITVFSFHPVKIMTTGEGGMLLTQSPQLAKTIALLRSHGITRDPKQIQAENPGPWYYEQIELGFNYRMTDIQAALGTSQMTRLKNFVKRRREIRDQYDNAFKHLPLKTSVEKPGCFSAVHLYVIRLDLERLKKNRQEIFEDLRAQKIFVNVHYIPVHLQPYYKKLGFAAGQFPAAEDYYARAISLPMFFDLNKMQQSRVVSTLSQTLETSLK